MAATALAITVMLPACGGGDTGESSSDTSARPAPTPQEAINAANEINAYCVRLFAGSLQGSEVLPPDLAEGLADNVRDSIKDCVNVEISSYNGPGQVVPENGLASAKPEVEATVASSEDAAIDPSAFFSASPAERTEIVRRYVQAHPEICGNAEQNAFVQSMADDVASYVLSLAEDDPGADIAQLIRQSAEEDFGFCTYDEVVE